MRVVVIKRLCAVDFTTFHSSVNVQYVINRYRGNEIFVSSYDDTNFDELVQNCFVVDDFSEPYEVEYMSKEGVTVLKDVINIFITDPTGFRRVLTVWGKNASNICKHLIQTYKFNLE